MFDEQTNGYVFSKEIQIKLERYKSKEEIKKWRVEKLNNDISFTKGMNCKLRIFDQEFEFEITSLSENESNNIRSYSGGIKNGGRILIAGKNNEYDFYIWKDENIYRIESLGEGFHLIEELETSMFIKNDCSLEGYSELKNAKMNKANLASVMTSEPVKIFVAYTPEAAQNNIMQLLIELCSSTTKDVFDRSEISSDIEIVGSQQLTYTESGNSSTDLNRFVTIGDGYLDEIHSLRNEYQADVCVLIVNSLLDNGIAAAIGASYGTSFFVVKASAAVSNYSFPHELGHLYGCRHDSDTGTTELFPV